MLIEDVRLGASALAYIRECLDGYTLPRCLLRLPLDKGYVHAYPPPETPDYAREQVAQWGLVGQPTPTRLAPGWMIAPVSANVAGRSALVSFIYAYLQPDPYRCVIFQDINADAQEPYDPEVPYFTNGAEVYRYAMRPMAEKDHIKRIIQVVQTANARLFVGLLTAWPVQHPLRHGQVVSEALLVQVAAATQHLVVGA